MFQKFGKVTLLALAAGIGQACEQAPSTAGVPARQMPGVRSGMLVTTEWLGRHLDSSDVVVVHVESRPEGYSEELKMLGLGGKRRAGFVFSTALA